MNGCRRRVARSRLGRVVGGRVRCSREPYAELPAASRPPRPPSCQPAGERRPAPGRVAAPRRPQTGSWAGRRMQLPAHVCTFDQSVRRVVHVQDKRLDDNFVSSFQPCADKCIYVHTIRNTSMFRSSFAFSHHFFARLHLHFSPLEKCFNASSCHAWTEHTVTSFQPCADKYMYIWFVPRLALPAAARCAPQSPPGALPAAARHAPQPPPGAPQSPPGVLEEGFSQGEPFKLKARQLQESDPPVQRRHPAVRAAAPRPAFAESEMRATPKEGPPG